MSKKMIWHPASELPPLHEESFEDDGTVYRSMVSDWMLVLDKDAANDVYGSPARIAHYVQSGDYDQWEDGGGLCCNVTHWMPLPEPPREVHHG